MIKYAGNILAIFPIILLLTAFHSVNATQVKGRLTDNQGDPIIGGTVSIISGDSVVTGTAADSDGFFSVEINEKLINNIQIDAWSIGHKKQTIIPDSTSDISNLNIELDEKLVLVDGLKAVPRFEENDSRVVLNNDEMEFLARRSLVPSNPIGAVRQPQAIRQGSGHSSKIRFNGTNPNYYLNDINIGQDPNHYGMFSILPSSVIGGVTFLPQGTSAQYGLPSIFNMKTKSPYSTDFHGSISISTVEMTSSGSYGNSQFYILGSIRKSVIDKLISNFELNEDKTTIPPTNFQDIYISSGVKLSPDLEFTIDGYSIRDYLDFKTPGSSLNAGGILTAQKTRESYIGSRLKYVGPKYVIKARFSGKMGLENYIAYPVEQAQRGNYKVDLNSEQSEYSAGLDITYFLKSIEFNGGLINNATTSRQLDLHSINWNFLPPDANSDKPHIYQHELNQAFRATTLKDTDNNFSTYTAAKIQYNHFELESGIRGDHFKGLIENRKLAYRHRLSYNINPKSKLELYTGTFYESPITNVINPYQVLIRYNKSGLKPIKTDLKSLSYINGPWKLGIFTKKITNYPALDPNYTAIDSDGVVTKDFFRMNSEGHLSFWGGSAELDIHNMPINKTELYLSYGFSRATSHFRSITVPYQLNAEHKFYAQFNYLMNDKMTFGADINLRSGFPYTPNTDFSTIDKASKYSDTYYNNQLEQENSETFPTYLSIGLYSELNWGQLNIHAAISNLTNHNNPIINTADGYVFDAGLLPSVGIKYTF